jgi:hypothetical protein
MTETGNRNIFHPHQVGHDTLDHLAIRLLRVQFLSDASLKELASTLGQLHALAQLESMKIGDDDLGPIHIIEHYFPRVAPH